MAAAACWGTYDMETLLCVPLSDDLVVNTLDSAAVPADKVKFYERVRITMIAKAILGMLKPNAVTTIMHKNKLSRYIDSDGNTHDDGPTLLKLIFLEVNPATRVSLQNHKPIISSAKSGGYGNNVVTILNVMENTYDTIITNNGSNDDYIIHLFNSLLSTKNSFFKNYIQVF